jgi:hypothetical protein
MIAHHIGIVEEELLDGLHISQYDALSNNARAG